MDLNAAARRVQRASVVMTRWLLVEGCPPPHHWETHRLFLSREGVPCLDPVPHPEYWDTTPADWGALITMATLGQREPPACLVVAQTLIQQPALAQDWAHEAYHARSQGKWWDKRVRLCVACRRLIPQRMLGYGSGPRYCGPECRKVARQARKTMAHYEQARRRTP